MNAVAITEQEKYTRMWTRPEYRQVAPGEQIASLFLTQAQPRADSEVIDFGAGTGRGALMLALLGRCRVHMLDFARNCLDPEVEEATQTQPDRLKFTQHDLTKPKMIRTRILDTTKAKTVLGWEPTVPMAEGICKVYDWYCANR